MSTLMNRPPPNTNNMPPSLPPPVSSMNSQTFVDKIVVGMDHAPQQFDLRGQLIGAGGANLHYIRNESGAIATLRGRGSMFIDLALGTESPDPLHLYIEHSRYEGLQSAKQLAKNLIDTLQQELVLYHQLHPPNPPNCSIYTAPPNLASQASQLGMPPTLTTTQMSVPPPMVAVPPPTIVPAQTQQLNALDEHHHYIAQANILPNSQVPPPNHGNMLQHQTVVSQSVPVHLHSGNVIMQQQITQVPTISNVSVPPPNLQIKPAPMLHLQGPPPNQIQLTQPPPSIQLHQTQTQNTQILLNQPQPSFQYQYVQQAPDGNTVNPNQITVQHIYQHQPPIQGLIQPQQIQQQYNPFAQPGQIQRQIQPIQAAPQYFVQGNNAYLVPPPNMISHSQTAGGGQQNIIFQTQPPPHIHMQHIQHIQTSVAQQQQSHTGNENTNNCDDPSSIKEESSGSPDRETSPSTKDSQNPDSKSDDQPNGDVDTDESNVTLVQQQQHVQQISVESTQLMNVPPPITCVQHIVGNTLITTTANQSQSHKLFNQIPVSIHQIQAPPQQIHVSAANGQHFLVQAHQPATQYQPVSQAGSIHGFHLASAHQIANDLQSNQAQQILTTAFNPHQLQAPAGMQVQFHQIHPAAQQQHLIQQLPAAGTVTHHLLEQPPPSIQTTSHLIHSVPPSFSVAGLAGVPPPTPMLDTMAAQARLGLPFHRKLQQTAVYSMSKTNIVDTQLRIGQKRKMDQDAMAAQMALSRSGIGNHSNAASITTTTPIATTTSSTASHLSSSNVQDEPHQGIDHYQSVDHSPSPYDSPPPSKQPSVRHAMTPPAGGPQQHYQFDGPPRAPPRFRQMTQRGEFSYPMRPPPPPMHMQDGSNFPMHRMNFRPPPPPPPYGPPPSHFQQW